MDISACVLVDIYISEIDKIHYNLSACVFFFLLTTLFIPMFAQIKKQ